MKPVNQFALSAPLKKKRFMSGERDILEKALKKNVICIMTMHDDGKQHISIKNQQQNTFIFMCV